MCFTRKLKIARVKSEICRFVRPHNWLYPRNVIWDVCVNWRLGHIATNGRTMWCHSNLRPHTVLGVTQLEGSSRITLLENQIYSSYIRFYWDWKSLSQKIEGYILIQWKIFFIFIWWVGPLKFEPQKFNFSPKLCKSITLQVSLLLNLFPAQTIMDDW